MVDGRRGIINVLQVRETSELGVVDVGEKW